RPSHRPGFAQRPRDRAGDRPRPRPGSSPSCPPRVQFHRDLGARAVGAVAHAERAAEAFDAVAQPRKPDAREIAAALRKAGWRDGNARAPVTDRKPEDAVPEDRK